MRLVSDMAQHSMERYLIFGELSHNEATDTSNTIYKYNFNNYKVSQS